MLSQTGTIPSLLLGLPDVLLGFIISNYNHPHQLNWHVGVEAKAWPICSPSPPTCAEGVEEKFGHSPCSLLLFALQIQKGWEWGVGIPASSSALV